MGSFHLENNEFQTVHQVLTVIDIAQIRTFVGLTIFLRQTIISSSIIEVQSILIKVFDQLGWISTCLISIIHLSNDAFKLKIVHVSLELELSTDKTNNSPMSQTP